MTESKIAWKRNLLGSLWGILDSGGHLADLGGHLGAKRAAKSQNADFPWFVDGFLPMAFYSKRCQKAIFDASLGVWKGILGVWKAILGV